MNNERKHAQSLIEYALILALVAIVAVAVLSKLSGSVSRVGNQSNSVINSTGDNTLQKYCQEIGKAYNSTTQQCE
jgi:Flp pilus assembly pilin Flp